MFYLRVFPWLFLSASIASAQPEFSQVHWGFPPSGGAIIRVGSWIPIRCELKTSRPIGAGDYLVQLETTDGEGAAYQTHYPIPAMAAGATAEVTGYLRPGSAGSLLTARIVTKDKTVVKIWPAPRRESQMPGPRDYLIATAGSGFEGLRKAAQTTIAPQGQPQTNDLSSRGPRKFAFLTHPTDLPPHSLGLESIDFLVLNCNSPFANQLLEPGMKRQRDALASWLRQGGKFLIDTGKQSARAKEILQALGVHGCGISYYQQKEPIRALNGLNRWVTPLSGQQLPLRINELGVLKPDSNAQILVQELPEPSDPVLRPLLVQIPFGRGRVLVSALQLEEEPFSTWGGQQGFWDKLLNDFAPRNPGFAQGKFPPDTSSARPEITSELQRALETYPGIPALTFGWIALLILGYLVLVGPVDFLITQKWFKLPELTWVTFPLVVILASWGAWSAAGALKGHSERINKADLVDFDAVNGTFQGTTWVSLFSPAPSENSLRLENPWNLGKELIAPQIMVLDPPDRAFRGGSRTLYRRPYEYQGEAGGIARFGIPAWACATFQGQWLRETEGDKVPFSSSLIHSRVDSTLVIGTITNHLSVDLQEAALFYQESWFPLGGLQAGETRRIDMAQPGGRGQSVQQWFDPKVLGGNDLNTRGDSRGRDLPAYRLIKALALHAHPEAAEGIYNSGIRNIDLGWRMRQVAETILPGKNRVRHAEEVLLVGRLAEKALPPTTLVLQRAKQTEAPVISQQTFLRAFFPIRQEQ